MRLLDRVLSRFRRRAAAADAPAADPRALARYRYLVHTASPSTLELIHREAFRRMGAAERGEALQRLEAVLPAYERLNPRTRGAGTDPATLARLATRAELRQPGSLLLAFGEHRTTGLFPGGLMTRLMGGALASVLAQALLDRGAFEREASAAFYANEDADADADVDTDPGGESGSDADGMDTEAYDEDGAAWASAEGLGDDGWDDRPEHGEETDAEADRRRSGLEDAFY